MTSLFRRDVLEATRMDGAKRQDEFYVLLLCFRASPRQTQRQ